MLSTLKKRKPSSQGIREEISRLNQLKGNLEADECRLKKQILELQRASLTSEGSPTGIKRLREALQDTIEKREAAEVALQDLEVLLSETEAKERLERVAEIERELGQINQEKNKLWNEFIEAYAKANVLLWRLTGHNPKADIFRPFATSHERRRQFLAKVAELREGQQSLVLRQMELNKERAQLKMEVER